ncbi:hypothetical protein [Nonomuraea turcica]|uniref:hypothetical protein n=1 Tax=Nonomuraea sp. G32 TaxID=3067274 RepID=UPI00273BBD82|nr:hypothetical protein [Nonomuraea sp. G32]MDP4501031.1 hypothetical protein [Nonomuraea sp. G32]
MGRSRTPVLDTQPPLFDPVADARPVAPSTPTTPAPSKPRRKRLRTHVLGLPRPWNERIPCTATCLGCRRPEDLGVCPDGGCAVVCGRPDRTGPVEVCLLTVVVPARQIGRYAVVTCPHCDNLHWHQAAPGRRFRVGPCRQPYVVLTLTG